MITWHMVAGYNGEFGALTVVKDLEVAFAPDKDFRIGRLEIEDICWNEEMCIFVIHMKDLDDRDVNHRSFDEIIELFTNGGWEVTDEDRV
jgi:hypothetical protein